MMRKNDRSDMIFLMTTVLSLAIVGMIIIRLIRIQRGLLGFVLAALAIVLIVYWMMEFRKTVREELIKMKVRSPSSKRDFVYDVLSHGSEMTVTVEVPGPQEEIKVHIVDRNLVIHGGQGFSKSLKLRENAEVTERTYRNGVLQVRLKKDISEIA